MRDGREKQTEACRLASESWLASLDQHSCGGEGPGGGEVGGGMAGTALALSELRDKLCVVAKQCARYVVQHAEEIRGALGSGSAQSADADSTCHVSSLMLAALREVSRCGQHGILGQLWLDVFETTCFWFDPQRQSSLPSPESTYMLAATAGLVRGGYDVGRDSEATSHSLADCLGEPDAHRMDVSIVGYWLAQLEAEPNGGCVRAVCARPAAWAALSSRVHGLIVSKAFGGSAAQALALQVLLVAGAFAVAPPPGSVQVPAPPSVSPAGDGGGRLKGGGHSEEDDEEVVQVLDDDDDDDDVVEVLDDEDEEEDADADAPTARQAGPGTAGSALDAWAVWDRCMLCGFAHVLGELIAVRDVMVAGLERAHVSRVRLLATVAAAAPRQVLELPLIHLDQRRRQALCPALHALLPATDVVVQTAAYTLLARFYTLPALLVHLDALEWETLDPPRESEGVDSSPAPSESADLLRAIPAPLTSALRTAADAAGQASAAASPAKAGSMQAAEDAVMSTESLGVLLAWLLVLEFRPRCSARLQGNISVLLRNQTLLQPLLSIAFAHVVIADAASPGAGPAGCSAAVLDRTPDLSKLGSEDEAEDVMQELATHILFRSVGVVYPLSVCGGLYGACPASVYAMTMFISMLARDIRVCHATRASRVQACLPPRLILRDVCVCGRSVAAFPSLVRTWYNELDRSTAIRVDKFVAAAISPVCPQPWILTIYTHTLLLKDTSVCPVFRVSFHSDVRLQGQAVCDGEDVHASRTPSC